MSDHVTVGDNSLEDRLNRRIPELAQEAFSSAYNEALEKGMTVVAARDGYLCEVHPNGAVNKIKRLPEMVKVENRVVIL